MSLAQGLYKDVLILRLSRGPAIPFILAGIILTWPDLCGGDATSRKIKEPATLTELLLVKSNALL